MEYVYMLYEEDEKGSPTGNIKIGKTTNVESSRAKAKTMNPRKLSEIGKFPAIGLEDALLILCQPANIRGGGGKEWFYEEKLKNISLLEALKMFFTSYKAPEIKNKKQIILYGKSMNTDRNERMVNHHKIRKIFDGKKYHSQEAKLVAFGIEI